MRREALPLALAAVALGAALTGCAAAAPSAEPEPTPEPLGKISTIEQLRDAYIGAGGVCNWDQTDVVTAAVASGTCSDSAVLMLFNNTADTEAVVSTLRSFDPVLILVGENWIINASDAPEMQAELGGTAYTS